MEILEDKDRLDYLKSRFTKQEAIYQIESIYGVPYKPESLLNAWQQLLYCERIAKSVTKILNERQQKEQQVNGVGLNGNVYGARKLKVDWELTQHKRDLICWLKKCTWKTPPPTIAEYLEEFFTGCNTIPGTWLKIAQLYPPRPIYRTLDEIVKRIDRGFFFPNNIAMYFNRIIKPRKKRIEIQRAIAARKQREQERKLGGEGHE